MTIETKRLYIVPSTMKDTADILKILSDEETMKFFVEGTYVQEQVEGILMKNEQKVEHYSIVLKETNKVIGKISFHPWFMKRTYEMGWIMNKDFTNQGYMSEATKAVLKYGFDTLKLHRIIATCQPENIPSKRLCEKLGMRLEGTFRQCIYVKDNEWWDELFYAILSDEYKKEMR
ncbi:GNAT family N-acetyltransferase [Candidatus Xianfuyuplasma coldseepsis]|uniref:GNAT family N-acetyltransferase n=1 Tax=Candidatus Xianfuyuplasma coldseepsis TaxID=2782163 RepID=A0A7L7KPL3_9MOLU|nr:GNAT family protein [Xianfuyuplasma coldseepsis]QMS84731.1 GNAT family N-acetyltransferase [Xianfuyuplasma coldseepsis]